GYDAGKGSLSREVALPGPLVEAQPADNREARQSPMTSDDFMIASNLWTTYSLHADGPLN
ncbi:MAG TPA: hypothetical protein VIH35_07105, partial [Kiritimatiellia bacterium]